jgi:hypothetical protein
MFANFCHIAGWFFVFSVALGLASPLPMTDTLPSPDLIAIAPLCMALITLTIFILLRI